MTNVLDGIDDFTTTINQGLDEARIDRSYLTQLDHVCYRVATMERYEELRQELAEAVDLLHAIGQPAMVNGRPIVTYQFNKPIESGGWKICYLELPAPKKGSDYVEGLEHAEFVVLGGDLVIFEDAHPHLIDVFSRKGMNKPINPELGLKGFGMSVKFHELALGKVVRLEQSLGLAAG